MSVNVSGWGADLLTFGSLTDNLNWIDMETIENTVCAYVEGSAVTESIICTQGHLYQGACKVSITLSIIRDGIILENNVLYSGRRRWSISQTRS